VATTKKKEKEKRTLNPKAMKVQFNEIQAAFKI
jgi:hypothetical protein